MWRWTARKTSINSQQFLPSISAYTLAFTFRQAPQTVYMGLIKKIRDIYNSVSIIHILSTLLSLLLSVGEEKMNCEWGGRGEVPCKKHEKGCWQHRKAHSLADGWGTRTSTSTGTLEQTILISTWLSIRSLTSLLGIRPRWQQCCLSYHPEVLA